MIFQSTRGTQHVSLDTALVQGLAQDGGLFLPQVLPQFDTDDFTSAKTVAETAQILLRPFFSESALIADLDAITRETFRFPLPVT
jgi:threonine synthase